MPHRIFLDVDGNETRREPMKRGRPPTGSYKDEDGNLMCPALVLSKPIEQKKVQSQDPVQHHINISEIKNTKKMKSVSNEAKMTLDEFLSMLFPYSTVQPNNEDGLWFIHNAYIKKHWYLDAYKKDLFDAVVPLIIVDPKNNIIRVWNWYGPKKEDDQGNTYYDFEDISPAYVLKGLLRPDELI